MILPIRTNIRPWRTPYANYALIAINVAIFMVSYWPHTVIVDGRPVAEVIRQWASGFMLTPARPYLWQFITYAFLHAGLLHIIGNMYFLYLFGNNVNDKLGHLGYVCFYLAGAVFSGLGHSLLSMNPVLGASGAVAAVTGAYLVLFPQTLITVVYFFFFIGTMELPALYFIILKLIFIDNLISRIDNVAYDAHLAGYAFGIVAIFILLATGLLKGTGLDLWVMFRQWDRRRRYRDVVSQGYEPFESAPGSKRISVKEIKKTFSHKHEDQILELRDEIASRLEERNLSAGAQKYLELISLDKHQVPPKQYLLDIANQLASENRHAEAAEAYEKFLTHYPGYEFVEQVELMLGIIYSRYLNKASKAVKYLESACPKLSNPDQRKMCEAELASNKGR